MLAILAVATISWSAIEDESGDDIGGQPQAGTTIRIATYNVLNLFDAEDDPAIEGEFEDLEMTTSEGRCQSLAAVIRRVNADVLALQEVESEAALRWFRDTYLADMGYDHLISIDVGYARGIENSVLSRYPLANASAPANLPINDVERHGGGWAEPAKDDLEAPYQRTPLRVDVATAEGYEMTLFVVHHKSGRQNKYRRESEALKLVELVSSVKDESPDRNIILLGDFNAAPWDRSMDVYRDAGFIDVGADPSLERPKTHESDRILDFVLMNSSAHRELVPGSVTVHPSKTPPKEYDWKKDPRPDDCPSDHRPVSIDVISQDRT
jgi:endonuclease/exonuclease/phosphatase family metal-dependent hydrolase